MGDVLAAFHNIKVCERGLGMQLRSTKKGGGGQKVGHGLQGSKTHASGSVYLVSRALSYPSRFR